MFCMNAPKGQKIDRKRENGMANRFEIRQTKNGSFRFNLMATNGQIIATSETYSSLDSCKNGVESVRKN